MAASSEPILIANENQKPEIEANFGELYRQVPSKGTGGSFELRPGVKLLLYCGERLTSAQPSHPSKIETEGLPRYSEAAAPNCTFL